MPSIYNIDLTGRTFNKLTVIEGLNEYSINNGYRGYQKWRCKCICGKDNLRGNKSYYTYNGIDRKDSSKGYTPENSLPCCTKCNFVKGSTSYDLFKQWITNITKNIDNIVKLFSKYNILDNRSYKGIYTDER